VWYWYCIVWYGYWYCIVWYWYWYLYFLLLMLLVVVYCVIDRIQQHLFTSSLFSCHKNLSSFILCKDILKNFIPCYYFCSHYLYFCTVSFNSICDFHHIIQRRNNVFVGGEMLGVVCCSIIFPFFSFLFIQYVCYSSIFTPVLISILWVYRFYCDCYYCRCCCDWYFTSIVI